MPAIAKSNSNLFGIVPGIGNLELHIIPVIGKLCGSLIASYWSSSYRKEEVHIIPVIGKLCGSLIYSKYNLVF